MLTLGIIDDGVGIFPMYYKLRQVANGNFLCMLLDGEVPLSARSRQQLYNDGRQAIETLVSL